MSLGQKTLTGILWKTVQQLSHKCTAIVVTLLLARFLVPEDYGLVAMMAVFLAVAESLMKSGFTQALIRLENARQVDFNTAFYSNIALGIISYAVLFFSAPYIAAFYEETRLTVLIRVAGLNILVHSLQVVQVASLSRNLNFKAQFQASLPAALVSGGVAVGLAYLGFGVWALITQMIVYSLVTTVLLWKFQGWMPTLGFSRESLKGMYNFGYKLFLSGLLNSISTNLYIIVIAKLFSTTIAGHYFFADKLKKIVIRQLVTSIQTVTYPALATLQSDHQRLKDGYRKVIGTTTFLLFPLIVILAATAQPLFELLLPEKWGPAAPYLQLMCLAGLFYPLHSINLNILKVKGRSDIYLGLEVFKKILMIVVISISYRYGVYGMLYGQIVSTILSYVPNAYYSTKLIGYTIREQLADFFPNLMTALSVGIIIYWTVNFVEWHPFLELIAMTLFGVSMYIVMAHLFRLKSFNHAKSLLMGRIGKIAAARTKEGALQES